ncbi:MAG TPA: hypothetical protein PKK13_13115 [Spirochaetota bacterium]|nr:hypothetical protein [Spirochaetota bacterium]
MKRFFIAVFMILAALMFSDEVITSTDGRVFLLKSNGTFEIMKSEINTPKVYNNLSDLVLFKKIKTTTKLNVDKIHLLELSGIYKSFVIHTDNNDVTFRRATLFFSDDSELEVSNNYTISKETNNICIPIVKKGDNILKKITLYWTAQEELSKKTTISIYGEK